MPINSPTRIKIFRKCYGVQKKHKHPVKIACIYGHFFRVTYTKNQNRFFRK